MTTYCDAIAIHEALQCGKPHKIRYLGCIQTKILENEQGLPLNEAMGGIECKKQKKAVVDNGPWGLCPL